MVRVRVGEGIDVSVVGVSLVPTSGSAYPVKYHNLKHFLYESYFMYTVYIYVPL